MTAGRKVNSQSTDWGTPFKYVNAIKGFFNGNIYLDPCSNEYSIVGSSVAYKLPDCGLSKSWDYPTIFVNPPYGRDKERKTTIKNWLEKCCSSHESYKSEVIALVPVATNTSHWKEFIWPKAKSICFLSDTRLKFLERGIESHKGAPMACCLVYWGNHGETFRNNFSSFGKVVNL